MSASCGRVTTPAQLAAREMNSSAISRNGRGIESGAHSTPSRIDLELSAGRFAADRSLPACHSLHFLQMACEKLCKASMLSAGRDPMEVHARTRLSPACGWLGTRSSEPLK